MGTVHNRSFGCVVICVAPCLEVDTNDEILLTMQQLDRIKPYSPMSHDVDVPSENDGNLTRE